MVFWIIGAIGVIFLILSIIGSIKEIEWLRITGYLVVVVCIIVISILISIIKFNIALENPWLFYFW